MTFGTTLIAVKQALKTNLAARPGLSTVSITYSYPTPVPTTGDNIWFGNAESIDEPKVMNDSSLDEDFRLNLRVQVLKTQGEGQELADVRCMDLMTEVQKELSQNPTLGLSVIEFAEMESWLHSAGPLEGGPGNGSAFDIKVRVNAILQ